MMFLPVEKPTIALIVSLRWPGLTSGGQTEQIILPHRLMLLRWLQRRIDDRRRWPHREAQPSVVTPHWRRPHPAGYTLLPQPFPSPTPRQPAASVPAECA